MCGSLFRMELLKEQFWMSILYFHGFMWLCRADWILANLGEDQTEKNLNKVFHNVETGQKLTHDVSGLLVPLDNILDPVLTLPAENKSHNVEHDCAAGSSLSELDLCLSPAQTAMFESSGGKYGGRRKRGESTNGFSLWNNGVVPYIFNSTFSLEDTDAILGAMLEWEKSTCIRFRKAVLGDRDFVVFKDGIRCSTNIGRIGNEQIVTLSSNCRTKRILIHELGHVIGLIHEHQRHDRDAYVKVIFENVRNISNERYQFSKLLSQPLTERTVSYDYTSIMHYGRNYFAKSPELTTLQSTDSYYQDIIGRAEKPSFNDIETVNLLYRCSGSCPPSLRCGDSCFMDSRCVCICRASVDHTFHSDPSLLRNSLLDSACEFFARRGDCDGIMKDTIRNLCMQSCQLYHLHLIPQVPTVTSTQSPSINTSQARLVTVLRSSNPHPQPSDKLNNSSQQNTGFQNAYNSTQLPLNVYPSTLPQYQAGGVGAQLPVNVNPSTLPQHQAGGVGAQLPVNVNPSTLPQHQAGGVGAQLPVNVNPSTLPQHQAGGVGAQLPVNVNPSTLPQHQAGTVGAQLPVNENPFTRPHPQTARVRTLVPINEYPFTWPHPQTARVRTLVPINEYPFTWPHSQKGRVGTVVPVNTPPNWPHPQKGRVGTLIPVNTPPTWPPNQTGRVGTLVTINEYPFTWPHPQKGRVGSLIPVNTPPTWPPNQTGRVGTLVPENEYPFTWPHPQKGRVCTVVPVNTPPTWPPSQKGREQQVNQHASHSSAPRVTFPQIIQQNASRSVIPRNTSGPVIPRNTSRPLIPRNTSGPVIQRNTSGLVMQPNTSSLFRPKNVRRQQLRAIDTSLPQRRTINNSAKTRPRNRIQDQPGHFKRRPNNQGSKRVVVRGTTKVPTVRLENLQKQNKISQRILEYRIIGQHRQSSGQQDQREILQPTSRQRQPEAPSPFDISSFIEFVIARHPSISQANSGTNSGNAPINIQNNGRADTQTSNTGINCQANRCDPVPWKNQFISRQNVSTTDEPNKLNRHLVLTDFSGPEFGLSINQRPPIINDIKTDSVLANDHLSLQEPVPTYLIKEMTSQSLANRDPGSPSRYPMEQGFDVPWGPPSPDLAQAPLPSGPAAGSQEPRYVSQGTDTFLINTDLVP